MHDVRLLQSSTRHYTQDNWHKQKKKKAGFAKETKYKRKRKKLKSSVVITGHPDCKLVNANWKDPRLKVAVPDQLTRQAAATGQADFLCASEAPRELGGPW